MNFTVRNLAVLSILSLIFIYNAYSQDEAIIYEVESGTAGTDYLIVTDGDITYAEIQTDLINSGNPGSPDRIINIIVNFPDTGNYDFYARIKIGPGNDNDDSFFYGSSLGAMDPESDEDWITVNNIGGLGFSEPEDVIYGNGGADNSQWKWFNFSEVTGQEDPVTFRIESKGDGYNFRVGGRENGILLDKIAFAKSELYYTVSSLENGEPGVIVPPLELEIPEGPALADGKCKFLGNVYSEFQKPYFELLWNQVIPENVGKWKSVEGTRDVMNWAELDSAYYLAKENGFPFQFHVLIWGNQQPEWIESLSTAEQLEEIEEWFDSVATRYPDIDVVQVVNEPLHDPPAGPGNGNYIEALGGTGVTGWDWLIEAFTMARYYFPDADLMINDYNIVSNTANVNAYIDIIELLQAEDLVDAVGVQAHAFSLGGSASSIKSNLDLLATTGLPIYATEFDISGSTDAIHLSEYQRIFPVFWENPAVMGVTLWGCRPGMWNSNTAYLLNPDGSERPSMTWLKEYVSSTNFNEECILMGNGIEILNSGSDNLNTIRIYPNPANLGSITIDGIKNMELIRVMSIDGREISSYINPGKYSMKLNLKVSPGIYIIQLQNGQETEFRKIVVE